MDWLSNLWWALKIAAVVFAVMVGGFTGHILASVLGLKRARLPVVVLGALLAGLAVWLALNRVGGTGWGFGGGGGGGFGSGSGTGLAGTARGTGTTRPEPTRRERPDRPEASERVRVVMLGGQRVREQRFYVLNGDPPRTWEQLVAVLDRRLRAEPRPRVIEIVIYRDSVDKDTEAVQRLIDWAKEHGLTVAPLFPPEDIPRGL